MGHSTQRSVGKQNADPHLGVIRGRRLPARHHNTMARQLGWIRDTHHIQKLNITVGRSVGLLTDKIGLLTSLKSMLCPKLPALLPGRKISLDRFKYLLPRKPRHGSFRRWFPPPSHIDTQQNRTNVIVNLSMDKTRLLGCTRRAFPSVQNDVGRI